MKQTGGIPPNLVEKCSKIVFPKVGDIVLKDWSVSYDDEEPGWSGECISASAVYVRPSLHFFSCSASRCSPPDPLFEGVGGSQMHASFGAQQKAKSDGKNTAIRQLANGQKIYAD